MTTDNVVVGDELVVFNGNGDLVDVNNVDDGRSSANNVFNPDIYKLCSLIVVCV